MAPTDERDTLIGGGAGASGGVVALPRGRLFLLLAGVAVVAAGLGAGVALAIALADDAGPPTDAKGGDGGGDGTSTTGGSAGTAGVVPVLAATWAFGQPAVGDGFGVLTAGSAVDALVATAEYCEADGWTRCDQSVGAGTQPSDRGDTTLDALLMWEGNVGAVGNMKRVRSAAAVARDVLQQTYHTLLVGQDATDFAVELGYPTEDLASNQSRAQWEAWEAGGHVPAYWVNATGRYTNSTAAVVAADESQHRERAGGQRIDHWNHDTIGMVAVDAQGRVAAGTSTSGLRFRIQGRVGDSPIMGAGAYALQGAGGCAATGNGDLMMRQLPCMRAALLMEAGKSPQEACDAAARSIVDAYGGAGSRTYSPAGNSGALICVSVHPDHHGAVGASSFGIPNFPYGVQTPDSPGGTPELRTHETRADWR